MISTMYVETLSTRDGDRITIIPSGFKHMRIVVFDDPAYNLHAKYLTNELYEKLVEEDRLCELERKIRFEE